MTADDRAALPWLLYAVAGVTELVLKAATAESDDALRARAPSIPVCARMERFANGVWVVHANEGTTSRLRIGDALGGYEFVTRYWPLNLWTEGWVFDEFRKFEPRLRTLGPTAIAAMLTARSVSAVFVGMCDVYGRPLFDPASDRPR